MTKDFQHAAVARALLALLLLIAAWPTAAGDADSVTAILITARDQVADEDFGGSIVLVMNNLGPAPIGIIINRPTPVPVAKLFPGNKRLASLRDRVYFGGPVEIDSVWFLFRANKVPKQAVQAFDGICISGSRELLLQLLGRAKPMDGLRIFMGHAGWAPGQLEAEIANGDWRAERAHADAVFSGKSEHPWPATEQGPKDTT
ncbi:MAG TPA: YqgE/AlgH family protein [Steroidobacteraceae bacterium]|nr:YqgE/AlgH family protein [Steroidobacteraceae bacterium]